MPANALDWALLAYIGLGAWAGFRRGLFAMAASLAASAVALLAAITLSGRLVTLADERLGATGRLATWLGQRLSLPPQIANLPAGSLPAYLNQLPLPAALRSAVAAVPPAASSGETLAEFAAGALAHWILAWVAFALIFLCAHTVIDALAGAWLRRAGRGGLGSLLGLVFGAAERALFAAILLAVASAALSIAPTNPIAQAIGGSRWAEWLLAGLSRLPTDVTRWAAVL